MSCFLFSEFVQDAKDGGQYLLSILYHSRAKKGPLISYLIESLGDLSLEKVTPESRH